MCENLDTICGSPGERKKENIQESERREGKEPFSVCRFWGGGELRSAGRPTSDRWMSGDLRGETVTRPWAWRGDTSGSSGALCRSKLRTARMTPVLQQCEETCLKVFPLITHDPVLWISSFMWRGVFWELKKGEKSIFFFFLNHFQWLS